MGPRAPRRLARGLTAATVLLLAACQSTQPSAPPRDAASIPPTHGASGAPSPDASVPAVTLDLDRISITLEPFATVKGGPLAISAPDDGSGRLFVAARNGQVWVVNGDGTVVDEPLVDLRDRIKSGGEQGLLGLAAHPDFATDKRVFVNFTDTNGDTVVARLSIDPDDASRLDPRTFHQLLFVDQPFANHNGGAVLFGRDRNLYLSLGDGGSGGDPRGNGQSLDTLLGKILRIDVGAADSDGYTIPPANPFASGGGKQEILHWGLRNPWRMSFDRSNGDLWIGDVGQGSFEEVDVARFGSPGLNFGWNCFEGNHPFKPDPCKGDEGTITTPIAEYGRDLGCTVIGGYVYRGSRYPFLQGAYLSADYCTGTIFAIDSTSTELVAPVVVGSGSGGQISAFGDDADGELYVTNLGGEISKVVATQR
jgi:glucose/arabinose dehydrogenase